MTPPRSHARSIHRAIALTAAAFLLAACGASLSSSAGKTTTAPIPLTDVNSALAELDRAENEISLHVPGERQHVGADQPSERPAPGDMDSPAAPASDPPAAAPPPVKSEVSPSAVGASPPAVETSDPCFTACRALASMERAASHLCGLTGEEDPRCDGAKVRVRNATERVRAGCPSCSG
jgi:hypothetical protein